MKRNLLLVVIFQVIVTGCGVNSSLTNNTYNATTNVELSRKNYHIIKRISGTANATYIMGIGGLSSQSLMEEAKKEMFNSIIDKEDEAYAVIYVTVEKHQKLIFPFYYKKSIIVSGYLIEFTE